MSEPAEAAEASPAGRGLRWATVVLGTLVTALLVYLVLLIPSGTSLIVGGTTTGDRREADLVALRTAANAQLSLFLNQNYRQAQVTMNALIDGSTGKFHDQLVGSSVTQINAAAQLRTVATGRIIKVSVTRWGGNDATLLAKVVQTVRNTQTAKVRKTSKCAAGSVCTPYYLVLTYQRVGGHWKMSNLEYLPL